MQYILDTQVLIWATFEPQKLSKHVKDILLNDETIKFVSTVSIWEISIKESIGKLKLDIEWEKYLPYQALELIEIRLPHILQTKTLPLIHRDPFDRLLVAQSMIENIPLIASDSEIQQYDFNYIQA